MNAKHDDALVQAFKAAKEFLRTEALEDGKQFYICCALESARCEGRISAASKMKAAKLINYRLRGASTLSFWLAKHHGIECKNQPGWESYAKQLQRTRHAWLDALIEEFSA